MAFEPHTVLMLLLMQQELVGVLQGGVGYTEPAPVSASWRPHAAHGLPPSVPLRVQPRLTNQGLAPGAASASKDTPRTRRSPPEGTPAQLF